MCRSKNNSKEERGCIVVVRKKNKNDKSSDPGVGVVIIILSNRMTDKVLDQGHVDTRIVWVKLEGPVCNVFFIVVHTPHEGRSQVTQVRNTIDQLRQLLQIIKKNQIT